jgi:hypothetical protein
VLLIDMVLADAIRLHQCLSTNVPTPHLFMHNRTETALLLTIVGGEEAVHLHNLQEVLVLANLRTQPLK